MNTSISTICILLLSISTSLLIAQDTLVVAEGNNGTFDIGFYSNSNRFGFKANGSNNVGFSAMDNTDGFRAEGNTQDGFEALNNQSIGFRSEGNGTGFRAYQNNFQGFISQENMFEGFLARENGGAGFRSIGNQRGYQAVGNSSEGYMSEENLTNGFFASDNGAYGFVANSNTLSGFSSFLNTSHGFVAEGNFGDGFKCESSGAHAGYFVNNDSTNLPAVYIAHGDSSKTDLKFGGHALISSEEDIYLDLDENSTTSDASIYLRTSDGSQLAVFSEDGTTVLSTDLSVQGGDLNVTAGEVCATNVTCSSDRRFKMKISPIESSLDKVLRLRGVTYRWDEQRWPGRFDDRPQLGFIAQELEQILPELVTTNVEGYKSVDYAKMTAVLVEAVKELKATYDKIRQENAVISEKLALMEVLERRISELEKRPLSEE